jgi:hypothetical protein
MVNQSRYGWMIALLVSIKRTPSRFMNTRMDGVFLDTMSEVGVGLLMI